MKTKRCVHWQCRFCNELLDTRDEAERCCECIGCGEFEATDSGHCAFCYRSTDFVLSNAEIDVACAKQKLEEALKALATTKRRIKRYNSLSRKGME